MPLDPSVAAVIQQINRKQGSGTVILGSDIRQPLRHAITSGSLTLDVALGGGWATNHWIEVLGQESAGKTMLVLKTIAANQKLDPNFLTVWFATEDFVDSYAEMMGCDLSRIVVENENIMETVYQHAKMFVETRSVDCIVIDSLPALVPAREAAGTMEDFQPGLAANLTGKFLRNSNPFMKRSLVEEQRAVTGFLINQWREKIGGYGDPRVAPMGKATKFYCFQRVDIKRDAWIKNTKDEPIGQTLKIVNLKNKIARPGRVGMIDAYFSKGGGFLPGDYDLVKDMVSAAIAYDVIEKKGKGWYVFGEERWYGRPNLDEALATDAKLRTRITKSVMKVTTQPVLSG